MDPLEQLHRRGMEALGPCSRKLREPSPADGGFSKSLDDSVKVVVLEDVGFVVHEPAL